MPIRVDAPLREHISARFRDLRGATERLAEPLSPEDQCLQASPSCSPTKWHRAHTTWFFETFLLGPSGVPPIDPRASILWNSYYETLGPRVARPSRGLLSRPSTREVGEYRRVVDERVLTLLAKLDEAQLETLRPILELGFAHEEQHQELLLTDILHAFHANPLRPAYRRGNPLGADAPSAMRSADAMSFVGFKGGLVDIGVAPGPSFRFDNEEPRHRVFLEPFQLATRLVTVREWKEFAAAGGYETSALWLSDGYDWVRANGVRAPLYAELEGGSLVVFGFDGLREAEDEEPITNLSYYEADALARFADARLPTEAEWEHGVGCGAQEGNFLESGALRARSANASDESTLCQAFGDAWEWTASPYVPYPGFRAPAGAVGEYNGKFMVNQLVLRGGSCLTPAGHARPTYRNFWHPETRFQVTGVRLARSGQG